MTFFDEHSKDQPAHAEAPDDLIARTLAEVHAARTAILAAFERQWRRDAKAGDDPAADAPP